MTGAAEMKRLLAACLEVHARAPALNAFCPCPTAPRPQAQAAEPFMVPAAGLLAAEAHGASGLHTLPELVPLRDAAIAAAPHARWLETYKGDPLPEDFFQRFGSYCLIGPGGPFTAPGMQAYILYMPPRLWYPRHHHPAEEIYYVIAGGAEFHLDGTAPRWLGPGEHAFHPSMRPHATETRDRPLLALVLWRGQMDAPPVLTDTDAAPPCHDLDGRDLFDPGATMSGLGDAP